MKPAPQRAELSSQMRLPLISKEEFNICFLLATNYYTPGVALKLIRECRDDIVLFGLEYAQRRWARFIGK